MFIIDPFSVRSILISLSLITIAINSFSTSYNTMSTVESKIRKRTEIAQSGIPYKLSDAYKYILKQNLMSIVKRNRFYCIIICICFLLSFLSIFIKPLSADNYRMIVNSTKPYITVVDISDEDDIQSTINHVEEQDATLNPSEIIKLYMWCTAVVSIITLIFLVFLICNIFKIQRIQINLLKLDKDFSFRQ